MAAIHKPSKGINVALWAVQILLAGLLAWAGWIKLFLPIEKLSALFPWAGEVSVFLVKFTGIIDLLGATGLIFRSFG